MVGLRRRLWKLRWLFFGLVVISLALSIVLMMQRRFPGEETEMGAGTLAMAALWLVGQVPGDVVYTNQLNHRIDVQFKSQRSEIRELRLFCSPNQGRDWDLVSVITPDKDYFVFRAPGDGSYWLRVASVSQKGEQFPDNPRSAPPNQKMIIDTVRPVITTLNAKRQGTDVIVSWAVQEDHPDVPSFRLEYQPKDGTGLWTAIPVTPAQGGETHFPANGTLPLQVRLTLRDLAGNQSFQIAEVAGDGVTSAVFNPMNHPGGAMQVGGTAPAGGAVDIGHEVKVPPPVGTAPVQTLPMPVEPQPLPTHPGMGNPSPAPGQGPAPAPPTPREDEPKVIASSNWTPAEPPVPARSSNPAAAPDTKLAAPPTPTRKLPTLQYINQPEFQVEYEVTRHGPSGIGSVELYRTCDDGQTWEKYAYDGTVGGLAKGVRLQRMVQFRPGEPDGIYGFTLVVKNRANIGRRPPQPGEVPEIRVKLDTKLPTADLLEPVRDSKPGTLLLSWRATDENLATNPIYLEWSEQRTGKWYPIGMDLPNTGRYSWKLPEEMPVNVFLRLRVRDLAGNERIVMTPSPLPVDLHEPEGHIYRVSMPARPQ